MNPPQPDDANDDAPKISANPGYALGQLSAAFTTSQTNEDGETRTRAVAKIKKWIDVLEGIFSGELSIGSRTPLSGTPAWATLEVVKGGFATGGLLASGPLQPHEAELLARLAIKSPAQPRAVLNRYYLSDAGIAELQQMLRTGRYRVDVPEEGALLVIAWLLAHDDGESARNLVEEIGSYLDRLRFYPVPYSQPLPDGSFVLLQTIGQTIENLQAMQVPERVLKQREAALIWAPLSDRAVRLFLETLEGPVPTLLTGPDGKPVHNSDGLFTIEGGWPCQHYPEDWKERAQTLLDDYKRLREQHTLCGKPEREGENFALLRGYLKMCVDNSAQLTGRDVGTIRSILAHIVTRRGTPDSESCRRLRQYQAALASKPTNAELADVVIDRLTKLPQDEGLTALDPVLAPVTTDEAKTHHLEVGHPVIGRLEQKMRRCIMAPVETLVEHGIVTSSEVLARIIPQITAQVSSASLPDPDLRRLYGSIYQAFRQRRSLLLLNLESQVKLNELPWVSAMNSYRNDGAGTQEQARQTLERVVTLAITSFPEQILPNKLIQELRALAKDAGLDLPFVDEVAADIFMGAFSEKFLHAAQMAGQLLKGTLYERYYGISYARVMVIEDVPPPPRGAPTSPAFYQYCRELAGPEQKGSYVAGNGTIIEQEQILTTHNLAPLFLSLGLPETLRPRLSELVHACFEWICRRQLPQSAPWKARLQTVKNMAYAWRQMIFFLALEDEDAISAFLTWASGHLEKQRPDFQMRFAPALEGLRLVVQGEADWDVQHEERRRFLGWSTGTHWLLAKSQAGD